MRLLVAEMEKQYRWKDHSITVEFEKGHIRVVNDGALKRAIEADPKATVSALINYIQEDYGSWLDESLNIPTDSFVLEIWGHVYFEYYLLKYSGLFKFLLPFGLYRRFRKSCAVIDCGEKGKDPNRWVWDCLATLWRGMGRWLPKVNLSRFSDF